MDIISIINHPIALTVLALVASFAFIYYIYIGIRFIQKGLQKED